MIDRSGIRFAENLAADTISYQIDFTKSSKMNDFAEERNRSRECFEEEQQINSTKIIFVSKPLKLRLDDINDSVWDF